MRGHHAGTCRHRPRAASREQLRVAVEANVRRSMRQLEETERRASLVGAIYELRTGRVRFLDAGRDGFETKRRAGSGGPRVSRRRR